MSLNDYYHKRLPFKSDLSTRFKQSFEKKSEFPGAMKDGFPVVDYFGDRVDFPVTVWNWLLGKIQIGDSDVEELCNAYKEKHDNCLFAHDFNERNFRNSGTWYSALPEIMCLIVLSELGMTRQVEERWRLLESSDLYAKGYFVEYPSIKELSNQPLNCQLFGLAWARQNVSLIGVQILEEIELATSLMISLNVKHLWSMYNPGRIASPFYNQLHLDQLSSLELINNQTYLRRLFCHYLLSPVVILIKVINRVHTFFTRFSNSQRQG